jgi:glycosyltransferase involved in cell wall biosynthesis
MLPLNPAAALAAQVYYALRRPASYFGSLAFLLTRPHPGLAARWKTLLHFGQGVYSAFLLRRRKITELHAHFLDRAATIALVAGRLLGVPYSLSIHAGADIYVHPVLIREKLSRARKAVTCTAYNKRHLEALLREDLSGKITCIPHGLDGSLYIPQEQPTSGRPLILSVGQLTERKGFRYLIEACALLRERGVDFECLIVGGGAQRPQLEELIGKLGLTGQVSLSGALPHEAVLQKYRQATLFVMPCILTAEGDVDGIPNVLLEAMAMQLPVISTEVSAIPELISPEQNGLLVPPNDAEALAGAILRLLGDQSLCESIARRGRETVLAEYDIEANIRRFYHTLWANGNRAEESLP